MAWTTVRNFLHNISFVFVHKLVDVFRIWTTATLAGKRAEVLFWPGSEAPNHGVVPYKALHYNGSVSFEHRVDTVLQWLDQDQPDLIMLYLSEPGKVMIYILHPDSLLMCCRPRLS